MPKFILATLIAALVLATITVGCKPATETTPTASEAAGISETQPATEVYPGAEATEQLPQTTVEIPPPNELTAIVVEQPTPQSTAISLNPIQGQQYPPALLQIEKPGDLSRLSSPILVTANVYPGDKGLVNVQLIGENGQVKADQLLQLSEVETGWLSLATWIQFEISAAGESGLIVVSTRDGYDRRIAQASVPVILLQVGESEVEKPGFFSQPAILNSPVNGGFAKNGSLHIEGQVHLANEQPIIIELISQTGGVVASKGITVQGSPAQDYVPFSTDLPYTVSKRTPVRMIVRQPSSISNAVDIWLYSLVLFLDP
jgi:hypothetical protein